MSDIVEPNSADFKKILAFLRHGNFAHPGEEEAIELTFKNIPKNPNLKILDIGCGLGGTANYLEEHHWGKVVGVDIDHATIQLAKEYYPNIRFIESDVNKLAENLTDKFDIIYLMNSFCAFPDQANALKQLTNLSVPTTHLRLFEYFDYGDYERDPILIDGVDAIPSPVEKEQFESLFRESGWQINHYQLLDDAYQRWYESLVSKIDRHREEIITLGGEKAFEAASHLYGKMLRKIKEKVLGGILIDASPS